MSEIAALIVEDDEDFRASLKALLERRGCAVAEASSVAEGRERIVETRPDVVLLDLGLPDGDGLDLLSDGELRGATEFVVISGQASVDRAVAALRDGALDFLTKPIDPSRLETILAHVGRTRELKQEVSTLREELKGLGRFGPMVGRSPAMHRVYDLITRVARTESTVLVTGESGTGKELVAETVHRLSERRDGPFLAVNCGAMSGTLIESELFGHEKGSFTGAERRRRGYFEEASGGTLLLDEITEMPVELQVKLLRVLENGEVVRVGATTPIAVDVRVVTASNRDPEQAVKEGALREDLFYRLNVFPIQVPPLRERGDDVMLLAAYFLGEVNEREGTSKRLTDAASTRLSELEWSGNVRELKNVIERAAILADDAIGPELLPEPDPKQQARASGSTMQVRVGSSVADVERRLILATLEELEGDKKRAAEVLGISLKTLYNRLNVYAASQGR